MSVTGRLNIEINVWCPECNKLIDLLRVDGLTDDGWIYDLVMPRDSHWYNACKDFSKAYLESFGEDFKCPHCRKVIYIGVILY